MSARGAVSAPAKSDIDLAYEHEMRLVRAWQLCRQVLYQGLLEYIDSIYLHRRGTDVYLTGRPAEIVRPSELTIPELPE